MRSIRTLAAVTSILVLATACGDGSGTPPSENQRPDASFTEVCTELSCVFTDTSTDPDEGGSIATRSWTFGEPSSATNTSDLANPTHAYAAAGTYLVTLTVTDDQGEDDDFSKNVIVNTAAPVNAPPTAAFTTDCDEAGACVFTSTSTDTDGTIATYAWNFGDAASGAANTSALQNPSHSYSVTQTTTFTVTLTVTDDDGAASAAAATQTLTIDPPPSLVCSPGTPAPDGKPRVLCVLDVTQRSTLTFTMTSHDCQLGGNKFEVTQPVQKTIFFNGCSEILEPTGKQYELTDASGARRVFDAGTQIQTRFTQGTAGAGSPPPGAPQIRLDGAWPTWTLNIDDGGNPGPGEPDFDDIVLTVNATRAQ